MAAEDTGNGRAAQVDKAALACRVHILCRAHNEYPVGREPAGREAVADKAVWVGKDKAV